MTDQQKQAVKFLDYGAFLFKATRKQIENLNETMIVQTAILRLVLEREPALGERYEAYREQARTESPLHSIDQVIGQFERIERELEQLKEAVLKESS